MTDWNLQAADNAGEQINTFRARLEKELRQILGDGANVISSVENYLAEL